MQDLTNIHTEGAEPNLEWMRVEPAEIITAEQILKVLADTREEAESLKGKFNTPVAELTASNLIITARQSIDKNVYISAMSALYGRGNKSPSSEEIDNEMREVRIRLGPKIDLIHWAGFLTSGEDEFSQISREALLDFLEFEIVLLKSADGTIGGIRDAISTLRTVKQYYEKKLDLRNSGDYEEMFREPPEVPEPSQDFRIRGRKPRTRRKGKNKDQVLY
ncbi:hypothetical protein A3H26_00110 [candidate division WWE3 bacterium RIFCSPLOWO2_12_FULL_36_10]|uniref:Uncharacterized protein n=1 Tax=candidate division WWE3 bacterium RIFCSPLOWO2_12_FULL_36_10 TaxID=1802630 RepID=A0A1F4VJX6_UNCKA|nr:MAG: hypothetical protein A3H26_00110 [candidate division WWE3 bacterium RIFCSPLOWO2_12_FULL_36_10]